MTTRQSAIRLKCVDCAVNDTTAIRCCMSIDCPLWEFRMGYWSTRNELYYDRKIYIKYANEPQVEFNRILKKLKKRADETV